MTMRCFGREAIEMKRRREVGSIVNGWLIGSVPGQHVQAHFKLVMREHDDLLPSLHVAYHQRLLLHLFLINVALLVVPQVPLNAMLQLLHAPHQ